MKLATLSADALLLELHHRLGHGVQVQTEGGENVSVHVHWSDNNGEPAGYARGSSLVAALLDAIAKVPAKEGA